MQKIFMLEPNFKNNFSTALLEVELRDGWRVVEATPVLRNMNQVSSTVAIIYILEKDEDNI